MQRALSICKENNWLQKNINIWKWRWGMSGKGHDGMQGTTVLDKRH
jgi:hypothetical protein